MNHFINGIKSSEALIAGVFLKSHPPYRIANDWKNMPVRIVQGLRCNNQSCSPKTL
jgi:hypothetical protein